MSAAQTFKPTVGLVEDLPMDVYRAAEGVSASDLKNMQRSPAFARMRGNTSTPAQEWGTAIHTAILEPDTLSTRYKLEPQQPADNEAKVWRSTKLFKEAKAELLSSPGLEGLLSQSELDGLKQIQKRVSDNPIGAHLQAVKGIAEASIFAWDDEFELWRKCRPDWFSEAAAMIVDVKSANDHRAKPFTRACVNFGYHMSAAYYLDTAELAGLVVDHYPFLVVNSAAPHEVATYTLDEDSIAQGRFEYRKALAEWRDCQNAGHWPGGSGEIQELRLPEYAINFNQENDQW